MKTITVSELHAQQVALAAGASGLCIIDVRSPGEFNGEHADGAVSVPLDTLSPDGVRAAAGEQSDIYVICQSGSRARMAIDKLGAIEGKELVLVEGGTSAWVAAGLPVITGKGTISIERQVRIAAGLLVTVGVVLGYGVHPGFLGISAFVGCGLVFAGVTDFCGMGLLLAKMPWNQVKAKPSVVTT